MKRVSYCPIYVFLLLVISSCSNSNPYEKLISDYVQTDQYGTWTDVQFESLEIEEQAPVKVSDSIAVLRNEFEKNKADYLNRLDGSLKSSEKGLKQEENTRIRSRAVIEMYGRHIRNARHRIDSLNHLQFTSVYDRVSPDKILLIPVRCKYSYVFPPGNPKQERTDIFYFTPGKDKITGQKQIRQ